MTEYLKSLIPFAVGVVLIVAGVLLPEETLRQVGYGLVAGGAIAFGVPAPGYVGPPKKDA